MFTSYDKALVSFISSALWLMGAFGFKVPLPTETILAMVPFITSFATFFMPNLPPTPITTVTVPTPVAKMELKAAPDTTGGSVTFDPSKQP